MQTGVRDNQKRVAAWLGIDISGATTSAQADHLIYCAPLPPSLVEDAKALGIYESIQDLPYGAAKDPIQRERLKWSKEELRTNEWKIGTLLYWTPLSNEPDTEAEDAGETDNSDTALWVVTRIHSEKGRVTIKPFGAPSVSVGESSKGATVSLVFPTHNRRFRILQAFRLRDAKVIEPQTLTLY